MANRYWVGGTANWDATAGAKWATISGGAGGAAVPTAADDVFFDAASGVGTCTVTAIGLPATTAVMRSLDASGFIGGLTVSASLVIGDASGGGLKLVAGMTYIRTGGTITFVSSSTNGGAGWPIYWGGKDTTCGVTFNGTGAWTFQDTYNSATGQQITLLAGTLNTNSQSITCGFFNSSNGNTRVLTLGASVITLTGAGTSWNVTTVGGLTLSAASSTIILAGASPAFVVGSGLGGSYGTVSFTGPGGATLTAANSTFVNLTRTGTATKTDSFSVGGIVTVTGTLTLGGNSTQGVNRLLVQSSVVGTQRTVNCTGAAVVISGDVDFMDIDITGAPSWTNTGAKFVGDALGNGALITTNRTTPATQTATGIASFTWSTHGWTTRVPLPQDNVVINNAFVAGQTVTADMPRLGADVSFAGCSGSPILNLSVSASVFGSLAFSTGMTTLTLASIWTFAGRGSHTVTSAGVLFLQALAIAAPGGTYTLADALNTSRGSASALGVTAGTFTDAGFTVTLSGTTAGGFQMSAGTLIKTGAWTFATTAATTFWAVTGGTVTDSGSITLTTASASTRTFVGGGKTYGTLTYTVANSPGVLVVTGANTFANIVAGAGRILTLPSSNTTTVTGALNVTGVVNGYVRLPGVTGNYATTPDSAALSIANDLDIRVRVALTALSGATQWLLAKVAGPVHSYGFFVTTAGVVEFRVSADGAVGLFNVTSTATLASVGAVVNVPIWIRATRDRAGGEVKFWTASGAIANPVAADFTQMGATLTGLSTSTSFDSSDALNVGAGFASGTNTMTGAFYRAQIRNGIDGALVFDADFTTKPFGANTFAEGSANAATVTINGDMAKAGDGRVLINASTPGTFGTISAAEAVPINVTYATIQDSHAVGGATFDPTNSVNVSGNTGWFRTHLSNQTDARWAVRTKAAVQADARWQVRTVAGDQTDARWAVRAFVADQLDARWAVHAKADAQLDTQWAARALAGDLLDTQWPVCALAGDQLDTRWAARQIAGRQQSVLWAARTAMAGDLDLRWFVDLFYKLPSPCVSIVIEQMTVAVSVETCA